MKKLEIVNGLSRSFNNVGLRMKKYSPEIMVVSGVVGVVVSAIMACHATTKLDEILEEPRKNIEKVHTYMENPDKLPEGTEYTEEDGKKDLTFLYAKSGLKVAKLYAPSVALGAVSIAAILGGHSILRKRNVALAAAYATIDKGFKEYRGRVIERFGKEIDRELRYNIKSKEIEQVEVAADGTEVVSKKTAEVVNPDDVSIYARFFDDGCTGWTKDPEYNLMFLKDQQRYANDLLQTRGHVFLNEIYDMLGIPRTTAGGYVGWIYDEKHPNGDNYVDFGIYNLYKTKNRDFVNGYERTILLDFNVDGVILDKI